MVTTILSNSKIFPHYSIRKGQRVGGSSYQMTDEFLTRNQDRYPHTLESHTAPDNGHCQQKEKPGSHSHTNTKGIRPLTPILFLFRNYGRNRLNTSGCFGNSVCRVEYVIENSNITSWGIHTINLR